MKKLTCLAMLMLSAASTCMAKSINLYDQPKTSGKVISTIDSNAGIITIFTPKDSGWVKVADPRNGNVGWVKSTELNDVSMQFNVMQTGNGSHGFQVMQYGDSSMTPEQIANMQKQMQLQQQAIQSDIKKMMNDMFNGGHQYWMSFPMIMPVVVMPAKTLPANANNQQSVKTTTEKK